jgi:hypothetical protein
MRTTFFTLYGLLLGIGYAMAIWTFRGNEPIAAGFWCVVFLLFFICQGWGVSANSEFSILQSLAWLTFLPLYFLYSLIGMAVFLLVLVPYYGITSSVERIKKDREHQRRLREQGRFVELAEITPKLDAGEGTLIVDFRWGVNLIWWTPDDLHSQGTPPTDDEWIAILRGKASHSYNDQCVRTYLAVDGGKAVRISLPRRLAISANLAKRFPQMKTVQLLSVSATQLPGNAQTA